jgi:uncharacterized membrane protein YfcA
MEYLHALFYLCPLIFFAGFIDSAVGGGGTISIPAYMLTGMPAHYVFGTNKLSASLGTALATGRFIKNRAIDMRTAAISGAASLIGAAIGSRVALLLDDRTFRILLLAALPCVAVFMALRKSADGGSDVSRFTIKKSAVLASAIGFCIGMYDGIIGPGTGTFAIIAFNVIMKYDLKTASGNAKVLNLASNIASLFTFALAGNVLYVIGLPTAACCVLGNYIGAGFAIKKGAKFLRPMLFVVLAILLIKTAWDLFAPL